LKHKRHILRSLLTETKRRKNRPSKFSINIKIYFSYIFHCVDWIFPHIADFLD